MEKITTPMAPQTEKVWGALASTFFFWDEAWRIDKNGKTQTILS